MKRFFLLLTITAMSSIACLTAQNIPERFAGIWQQKQKITEKNGSERIVHLPVWKILNKDGTFCTFLIANRKGESIITTKGTFAITDETTYVEHITGSITDPSLVNKDNIIKYTFTTDNTMTLTYRIPGAAKEAVEMWTRVKMAMPGQER